MGRGARVKRMRCCVRHCKAPWEVFLFDLWLCAHHAESVYRFSEMCLQARA